jgi:hypothetical protein
MMDDLDNLRSAVVWGLDTGVEEDEQTAVAIIARLAYEAATRGTGIGRWAEQAVPVLERSTPGFRNAVLGAATAAAQFRGDFDASDRYARAALEDGYPPDDPSPCLATVYLAVVLSFAGRRDDAARHLEAAEEAMVGRDDEDYVRIWLQQVRVIMSVFGDDEEEQIAQARLAMSLAERTGNPTNLARASFALGWAVRYRDPDEAIAALDRAVELGRRGAGTASGPSALSVAAGIAASQGDAEGAITRLRDALEESVRAENWQMITTGLEVAVDIFCYVGQARAATILAGAVETTLAPLRNPYHASRGPGLAVRTSNLGRARETLGDSVYEQARAEGVAMSRQDALAFVLQRL